MSMRPAKHIKGDRSSVLLRLAPKSLVFGLFGAISGSESPLTRRIRTPGQLQRLRRPHTHKPRARTPQARWKRPRPHHRRRSRERRDGATPFGLRAATNSSAATPRWRATAWRTYRPTRKRRRCRLGRAWTRSRFEPGLSATGGDPAHGRARAPERVRARKNCWTPRPGPWLGPEQLGGHPRHHGVHPPTRLHLPAAEEKSCGSGRATVWRSRDSVKVCPPSPSRSPPPPVREILGVDRVGAHTVALNHSAFALSIARPRHHRGGAPIGLKPTLRP